MTLTYMVVNIPCSPALPNIVMEPNLGAWGNLNRARRHFLSVVDHYRKLGYKCEHYGSSRFYEETPIKDEYMCNLNEHYIKIRIEKWKRK